MRNFIEDENENNLILDDLIQKTNIKELDWEKFGENEFSELYKCKNTRHTFIVHKKTFFDVEYDEEKRYFLLRPHQFLSYGKLDFKKLQTLYISIKNRILVNL